MQKNYYLVLGLASDASPGQIKDAYRSLAKEYHPDRYKKKPSPFLEIQEAYSVLSDPVKRRRHDLSIKKESKGPARPSQPIFTAAPPEGFGRWHPGSVRSSGPEPLVPGQTGIGSPEPLAGWRPQVPGPEAEVWLSPEQAIQGGRIRIPLSGRPAAIIPFPPGMADGQRLVLRPYPPGFFRRDIVVRFRLLGG